MRSKAAIGGHPIHPVLVTLPIGAFFLTLVGDVAHTITGGDFWYQFSFVCMGIGILTALLAAAFGLVDYFGIKMNERAARIATTHLLLNVGGVLLYTLNWFLRRNGGALHTGRWSLAFGLEVVTFLALGASGWLGGRLSFEHHIGVVEPGETPSVPAQRREIRGYSASPTKSGRISAL